LSEFPASERSRSGALGVLLVGVGLALLLFVAWPYAALWRIDRAVRGADVATFAELVDLASVRAEIRRTLNKEARSNSGEMSDSFIHWLEEGIGVAGSEVVERLVTVPWVQARLLDHSGGNASEGFLGQITYAFFSAPNGFLVRIGPAAGTPVRLQLKLTGLRWRVVALSY
jgi:hypothetical protein